MKQYNKSKPRVTKLSFLSRKNSIEFKDNLLVNRTLGFYYSLNESVRHNRHKATLNNH